MLEYRTRQPVEENQVIIHAFMFVFFGEEIFIIAVYVDDIIVAGKDKIMKDMGKLHHFLGIKIIQKNGTIWIGQSTYAKELLKRFKMEESKPVETPFDSGSKLEKAKEEDKLCNQGDYQSAVGSLLYLSTRTRPDIAFAVGYTARYCSKPTNIHWTAVKRIMRYLNGSLDLGLFYMDETTNTLVGYSDADWAGDIDDRKSTSGYLFRLSGSPISWKSKKQSCVALSTAESEYMALASAIQEAVWLRRTDYCF